MSATTGSATSADEITQRTHTAQGQPDGTRLGSKVCDTVYVRKRWAVDGTLEYGDAGTRSDATAGVVRVALESKYILVANQIAGEDGK